ncbi:DUF4157 domain-containing protein [Luteibacter yeojuensis]|uniref:DUF4157 domain-containing protein n=1 Tax=Luteibacter yeojuensis TaxID=345309 RepID=A0A7X5QSN7_9GAMM|nr:DUF4157 domain-containing protein [Luteibacter yeojuensis]NID14707.1 DUF4157 domain-containing protein [Luteibacter yeojuensis]
MARIPPVKADEQSRPRSAASSLAGDRPAQRRSEHAFGDSPRQLAQGQAVQRVQDSPMQVAQRRKTARADGLPDPLRTNMEAMSGVALDDVRVHRNSGKPAQMQAHAYAQGRDIYLGAGQEKHLPHEAWHVVQQAQGRVKPTRQMKEKVAVNDDTSLEREADIMGAKAMQLRAMPVQSLSAGAPSLGTNPVQRFINVTMGTNTTKKKSIVATGKVKKFKGGTTAGTRGWINVRKYRAWYSIEDDDDHENTGSVGPLQNAFTNPEAGHVLAKQNGGNGGDPENVFAQCGGTNNSLYKTFENGMRADLDKYDDDDTVTFKAYLVGTNMKEGVIADSGLSSASEISSDESSSDSSDSD